jgi:hypothetical protein
MTVMLTAGKVQMTSLLIEREPGQVHGAGAEQGGPDAVQYVSIRINPDIEIGCKNLVKPRNLLISEESVRHPHLACICHGQVTDFT